MNQLLIKLNELMLNKEKLLTGLLDISQQQNRILSQPVKKWDLFNDLLDSKQNLLGQLTELDDSLNLSIKQLKHKNETNSVVYRTTSNKIIKTFHKLEAMVEKIKVIEEMNKKLLKSSVSSEKLKMNNGKKSTIAYNNNNFTSKESYFFDSKN